MIDRETRAVRDSSPVGGKTLLEHGANVSRRMADLARESENLAAAIQERIFGPEPRDTGPIDKELPTPETADGHLHACDRSLNIMSNTVDQLRRIVQRLGSTGVEQVAVDGATPNAPPRAYGR